MKIQKYLDSATAEELINLVSEKLLERDEQLEFEELKVLTLFPKSRLKLLLELAHKVRLKYSGDKVEIEGILSAKTGACPEDCHFCSQSSLFESSVKPTAFLDKEEILKAAVETKNLGATEFCIVLALRGPNESTMKKLEEVVPLIIDETGLNVSVSAGILTKEQALRLKNVGTNRYNHNLETAKSYFDKVVTTHSFEDRLRTCQYVKEVGMELCSGLIFGMGETFEQRVEALDELKQLDPQEVPINFLNPRPGTPFENLPIMDKFEALKCIAIARLALPKAILRYAGGREVTLKDLQHVGLKSGINALIIGNYLTTLGRAPKEDLEMLKDLNMPIGSFSSLI